MGDQNWLINFLGFLVLSCFFIFKFFFFKFLKKSLPPGPPSIPIIGHLHLLKQPIHRTLDELSKKYGHIMFLKFGFRNVVVISSPEAIEECFKKNDVVFANRPLLIAGKHLDYNNKSIGFSSYGNHWRNARRLATLEFLSVNRLNMYTSVRRDELCLLLKNLYEKSPQKKIGLRPKFTEFSFNIVTRMIAGKRFYGEDAMSKEAREFREIICEVEELLGVSNLSDYLPILRWLDFEGLKQRMNVLKKKMDKFLQSLLDEQRRIKNDIQTNVQPPAGSAVHSMFPSKFTRPLLKIYYTCFV